MGRLQPSVVMAPNSTRRADRAKKAKDTINKVIPELLRSSPRARHGAYKALLMLDPPSTVCSEHQSPDARIRIRLRYTDTLTAARQMTQSSRRASISTSSTRPNASGKLCPNVCVLNMASPLRPGGGFLDGATSQEEFLCMRTTLYPSLWDDFYRLPEVGGVHTPDVLVFRDSTPEAEDLPKRERFFVDVISAGMLRFPETTTGTRVVRDGDEERGPCSCGVSYCDKDRELVTRKMKAVLRMAQSQGAEKLVLGAWGCGAYGNPVREVAKIWKRVLCGTHRKTETWTGIKEVVFAINDRSMLKEFERCFADVLTHAGETVSPPPESYAVQACASDTTADPVTELVTKIQETEMQLEQITNPRSKARLRDVLAGLNHQLVQVGSTDMADDDLAPIDEEDFVVDDFPPASADLEESNYYNFDEDDIASSGSSSPTASSLYEFRFRPDQVTVHEDSNPGATNSHEDDTGSSFEQDGSERRQLDASNGWFSGSINGLSALLNKSRRAEGSPVLRPGSMGNDVEALDLDNYLRRFSSQEA